MVDKNPDLHELLGYIVSVNEPETKDTNNRFIISIGNNKTRKEIAQSLEVNYITLIHPRNNISKRAYIGEGTVAMAGVSVNSSTQIGKHVILNTNCSVDHDCVIEDFAHISPNAALAGNVQVERGPMLESVPPLFRE